MDLHTLDGRKHDRIALVVQSALDVASNKFITDPADPGWGSEYSDERLEAMILDAAIAINEFNEAKKEGVTH